MNIIVKAIAGSHLFGTNTPTSDQDFKGIYLPSKEDILLQKISPTIHQNTNNTNTKNSKDDIDVEFFSLGKFFSMLAEGQTVAFELLFTPDHLIIEKSPIWNEIVSMRDQLVHKQVKAFVGYCQQQANKYGIKGSRMGAIKSVIDEWKSLEFLRIESALEKRGLNFDGNLIKLTDIQGKDKVFTYLEICGKKYDIVTSVGDLLISLQKQYDNYGERAKLAELNQGIDWKAISHALRVCFQAKELLTKGTITLPLEKAHIDEIMMVKTGKANFTEVSPRLEELVEEIRELEKVSQLREKLDQKLLDDFLVKQYTLVVRDWN